MRTWLLGRFHLLGTKAHAYQAGGNAAQQRPPLRQL
jgi:hypothetical protein